MRRTTVSMAAPFLAAAAFLSACGSSSHTGDASGSPATTAAGASASSMLSDMPMPSASVTASQAAADANSASAVVHIKDFAFSAPSKPILAGQVFTVVNDDSTAHTYEDVKHAFDSGTIKPGASAKVKAPAAGTYAVKCDFHPSMHGTLTVA